MTTKYKIDFLEQGCKKNNKMGRDQNVSKKKMKKERKKAKRRRVNKSDYSLKKRDPKSIFIAIHSYIYTRWTLHTKLQTSV